MPFLVVSLAGAQALRTVLSVTAEAGPFVVISHVGCSEPVQHELTGPAFVDWFDHLDYWGVYGSTCQLCVWFLADR